MDYRQAIARLLSLVDHERTSVTGPRQKAIYDLKRMEAALDQLGNPQHQVPAIHIAGTKGKGSTAAMVTSVLRAASYQPGLFTSPHLHTFRERIRVGDQLISEEDFGNLVEELWLTMEGVVQAGQGRVTLFELLTAMAFHYFRGQGARSQVIEVGLGGRLDSTNLVHPLACGITSLGLDHTEVLGDTLEQIAWEKAGIIKPGSVAVVGPQPRQAMDVIEQICRSKAVPLVSVEKECKWTRKESDLDGQSFRLSSRWGKFDLWIPLLGRHQMENASTALVSLQVMAQRGLSLSPESVATGFRSVKWPGRLEVLGSAPLLVVDGAHNPHSAKRLIEALREYFEFRRLIGIVGVLADKSLKGIARELSASLSVAIATKSRHPRSVSPGTVAEAFHLEGVRALETCGTSSALEHALGIAKENDLILVTGSLFVVAEAREAVLGIPVETYPSLLPEALCSPERSE